MKKTQVTVNMKYTKGLFDGYKIDDTFFLYRNQWNEWCLVTQEMIVCKFNKRNQYKNLIVLFAPVFTTMCNDNGMAIWSNMDERSKAYELYYQLRKNNTINR